MNEQINVGDIVISKSHRKRGKVMKINNYDYSVLVEVIVKTDKKAGTRTTKLLTFAMSDLKLYRFRNKKDQNEEIEETQPKQSNADNATVEIFKNAPKVIFSDDTLKSLENAMKLNRLVNTPTVNIPELKGQEG